MVAGERANSDDPIRRTAMSRFSSFHVLTRIAVLVGFNLLMFYALNPNQDVHDSSITSRSSIADASTAANVVIPDSLANANTDESPVVPGRRKLQESEENNEEDEDEPIRILHIVTALRDINNGARGTKRGEDRLVEVFIPILTHSVESMLAQNYQVDVYLILGWDITAERRKLIEDALPEGVGLQVWSDATPLGYDSPKKDTAIKPVTRGLARQHRFVIKDKLQYYDLFTVFEDDMLVTGQHVNHYLEMTEELNRLKAEAPEIVPEGEPVREDQQRFHGALTKKQLSAMIPGFVRVEVLVDEKKWPSQKDLEPIPVDLQFSTEDGGTEARTFDPAPCCHVPDDLGKMPPKPKFDEIMIWETAVRGTVIRQMPKGGTNLLDWVMLQPGKKDIGSPYWTGGYWSGKNGAFGDMRRPGAGDPQLIAQQGGWMLTREQLIEVQNNHCGTNFFPPFEDSKHGGKYHQDGLTLNNVEFWSGGYSLFSGSKAGCNMQRVINLHPDHFSKHFLYHTANNKQKTLSQNRFLKANNFLGQINSVVKAAKKSMARK